MPAALRSNRREGPQAGPRPPLPACGRLNAIRRRSFGSPHDTPSPMPTVANAPTGADVALRQRDQP